MSTKKWCKMLCHSLISIEIFFTMPIFVTGLIFLYFNEDIIWIKFYTSYFAECYVWYLKSLSIKINDLNFSKTQMTILRQYFAYLEANKITRTKCYLMCVNDYLYRLKCFVCIIIRREVLCYCCCYSNIYLPFVTKFVCFRDFQNNLI